MQTVLKRHSPTSSPAGMLNPRDDYAIEPDTPSSKSSSGCSAESLARTASDASPEQQCTCDSRRDHRVPVALCAPHLVAAMAEANPDAIALSEGSAQMTYAELDARSNRLGAYLRSLGVGPDVPVGICLERSFDYVIAALAAWKAGGAYLPIDPQWPVERREFILEDAGASVLITRSGLACKARYIVDLDATAHTIAREQLTLSAPPTKREHLAYIIYTSGSTGKPKGVEVTHGNLLNLIFWHRRVFGVTPADRASHLAGLAFDAAVWELWPYLTAGASIALVDDTVRTSPDLLRDWITARKISDRVCAHHAGRADARRPLVAGLRFALFPHRRRHAASLPVARSSLHGRKQLRTYRVHRGRDVRRVAAIVQRSHDAADRCGDRQHADLFAGRKPETGSRRAPPARSTSAAPVSREAIAIVLLSQPRNFSPTPSPRLRFRM